jgi:hypothetical protein
MVDTLIQLLETLGFPVMRQGSLPADQQYTPTFITFWGHDDSESFYDNDERCVIWSFYINVYSDDPDTAYNTLDILRAILKQNGWTIIERGRDVPSDEITHIGRGCEVCYMQYNP